ncbi:MAG: sensor histidine kinase [Candidatus Pristimantibacillus sp.]
MFQKSIRGKLMTLLLAVTIIPIIISMIISNNYIKNKVTEQSTYENQKLLSLGKNSLSSYMDMMNRTSLEVYNSLNMSSSLYALIERGASANVDPLAFDEKNRMTIYTHLLNMYQSNKGVHQIYLQMGDGQISYLFARGLFRSGMDTPLVWPTDRLSNPLPFIEATHMSGNYELDPNKMARSESVFTLHRPIIRTPSDEVIGYLTLEVKAAELSKICKQLTLSKQETFYIMDRDQNVICSENEQGTGQTSQTPWADTVLSSSEEIGVVKWKDETFSGIVIYDTLSANYMDWVIVKELPYSYLYESADTILTINTLIIVLSMIVVVIASLYVSYHFTKPIRRLISHINQVQSGNFNIVVPVQGKDEIGILARRFNTMIGTINDLVNREYRLEIANKTNQLKAMQAQINPHFLYNAFQSIGTLALHSQAPKVYSLITAIAKMMRYNMNTNEAIVPFTAELNHAKAYLELQKQRFNEHLTVNYQIDPASLPIQVPKMLLQPLVENYFKHGYETAGGRHGEISITSEVESEQWLIVRIKDNGGGMEPAKLYELRQMLFRSTGALLDEQKNIGISNVWMRLKLYYNDKAVMGIDSESGGGFAVTLRIPLDNKLEGQI